MTDQNTPPSGSPLGFSPSASINRFLALHRSSQRVILPPVTPAIQNLGSTSVSKANTKTATKKRKTGSTASTKSDRMPQQQSESRHINNNGSRRDSKMQNGLSTSQMGYTAPTPSSASQSCPPLESQPHEPRNTIKPDHPRLLRPPDPLPPPTTEEHRYIISTRLLQNNDLSRALQDHELCRLQFIERDVEYLRVMDTPFFGGNIHIISYSQTCYCLISSRCCRCRREIETRRVWMSISLLMKRTGSCSIRYGKSGKGMYMIQMLD